MGFRITKYNASLSQIETVQANTTPANSYSYSLSFVPDANIWITGGSATGFGVRLYNNTIDTSFVPSGNSGGAIPYTPFIFTGINKYNVYTKAYVSTTSYRPNIIVTGVGYSFDLTGKALILTEPSDESTTATHTWSDLWSITVSSGWTPYSGKIVTDGTYGYGYIVVKQNGAGNFEKYLVKFLLSDPTSSPTSITETAHGSDSYFSNIIYNIGDTSLITYYYGGTSYYRKYNTSLTYGVESSQADNMPSTLSSGLLGNYFWSGGYGNGTVNKRNSADEDFGTSLGSLSPSYPSQSLTGGWGYYGAIYHGTDTELKKGYITFKLSVDPDLTITPSSFGNICSNTDLLVTFTASGGLAPYTYTLDSGLSVLPPETIFTDNTDGTATFEGTSPLTPGDYRLKFTLEDSNTDSVTVDQNFTVFESPVITDAPALPDGLKAGGYSHNITYTAGAGGLVFTVISGLLPPGLALNSSTGEISGTPSIEGSWTFTLRLVDENGCQDTKTHTLTITNEIIISGSLPAACQGSSYSNTLSATGGVLPYTWAVISGALPETLTLNSSTGEISGTLTDTAGTYSFTVTVQESSDPPVVGIKDYAITIYSVPTITTVSLPSAYYETPYTTTLHQTGGDTPVVWTITAGTLPTGLSLDSGTGVISGTPTVIETANITVQVASSHGCIDTANFDLFVDNPPNITSGPPPNICLLKRFFWQAAATTINPPVVFSITDVLPEGIIFDGNTGIMEGQTSQAGTFPFLLTATDAHGLITTQGYQVVVYNSPIIETPYLPVGSVGKQYDYQIQLVSDSGTYPFTWLLNGSPPAGLTFNAIAGTLTGVPQEMGSFAFDVRVEDAHGCSDSKLFYIQILGYPIIITASLPPTCAVGTSPNSVEYYQQLQAEGGTPPYYWFVTMGGLPTGLELNPYTGEITGKALYSNVTYTFTIQVVDQNSLYAEKQFSIKVRTRIECGQDDEGPTVTIVKQRLTSMESDPIVVEDPFHQKHMIEYLPVPMQGETPNG